MSALPGLGSVKPAELTLAPTTRTNPDQLDLRKYEPFIRQLCGGGRGRYRDYQAAAIRAGVAYLLGGRYRSARDLVAASWDDETRHDALVQHYGTRERHEQLLTFPDQLAGTIDLATGTGKSYVLYGIARIALNEGVGVRRVLVLCPNTTIRAGLHAKFHDLLRDDALNRALDEARGPDGIARPTLTRADRTLADGDICIENVDQTYRHVGSSLRDSVADGAGSDTLVLNDEAHHVYDVDDDGNTQWHQFLSDPDHAFRRILGVSGTCFIEKRRPPHDYMADVIYRYSLRQAIEDGFVKNVKYMEDRKGSTLTSRDDLYQAAIWKMHQANKTMYGHVVKPVTIVIAQSIQGARAAAKRFTAYVKDTHGHDIDDQVLVVTSDRADADDRKRLANIDAPSSTEPAEFVFSVSMLTEGWDAKNVFLVVPYDERAFDSHLLVAQVLGRGLRIPEVSGLPRPVVRVFNHTKWSGRVAGLVRDVLDTPNTVTVGPYATTDAGHFTVHTIEVTTTTTHERREATPTPTAPDVATLLQEGVPLVAQRGTRRSELGFTEGSEDSRDTVEVSHRATFIPADTVIAEQWKRLRNEATGDRKTRIEQAGRDAVKDFVHASMRRSGLPDDGGLSQANIDRIRAGLLACFPLPVNQTLFARVPVHHEVRAIKAVATAQMKARTVTVDRLRDPAVGVVWSPAAVAGLTDEERRRLSAVQGSDKVRKLEVDDWRFKTPITLCIVTHDPEWQFVKFLTDERRSRMFVAWVKSPDRGFYEIQYTPDDDGATASSFNPDWLLVTSGDAGRHVYIVETKSDDDRSAETADKARAGDRHVDELNSHEDVRERYSFHLLTPDDYIDFFAAVADGTGPSFVGSLHQSIRSAEQPPNAEAADVPDDETDEDLERFLADLDQGGWDAVDAQ